MIVEFVYVNSNYIYKKYNAKYDTEFLKQKYVFDVHVVSLRLNLIGTVALRVKTQHFRKHISDCEKNGTTLFVCVWTKPKSIQS